MDYKNIIFQIEEQMATITFNRPKVLNALNEASLKEFSHAIDKVAGDEDIRVLILTGAGDKSFIAGADITEFLKFNALKA
ncbi:MAG: enoyl-CoA hydratase-related protein, partial [Desulfobacteraceae bacterium]|nr:enoyl-CoA hydratase-related protein [Desulfobacteraceae bacterium]